MTKIHCDRCKEPLGEISHPDEVYAIVEAHRPVCNPPLCPECKEPVSRHTMDDESRIYCPDR